MISHRTARTCLQLLDASAINPTAENLQAALEMRAELEAVLEAPDTNRNDE